MLYLRLLVAALFAIGPRPPRSRPRELSAAASAFAVYTRGRRSTAAPLPSTADSGHYWHAVGSGWRGTLVMVEPDTVVRWHRSAWRAYWRWKSRRGPGRPHIPAEWQRLILRIATENPRWGAVRIVGELRALGFDVSARTVSRYRQQALRRPPSQSWRTFLRNHASSIWAADLVHGADPHLPHALRVRRDRPRPVPHPALERHGAPDRALDLEVDDRGDRLG